MEYLTNILASKVYDVAYESSLQLAMKLSRRCGVNIWLKREDLQHDMLEEKMSSLEPAGTLALTGAEAYCKYDGLKGANVVAVTSGANMNFDRILVTEVADVGRRREDVLATYMPGEPGSFKQFCKLVGPINITEFKYRYNSDKVKALGLHTDLELEVMVIRMNSAQRQTINLTENDFVKDHLQHLGETGANVLVGIQVALNEMGEFWDRANNLRYEYEFETSNEAFQLLMR